MKYLGLEHKETPKETLKYICIRYTRNGHFALLFEMFITLQSKMKMSMLILV